MLEGTEVQSAEDYSIWVKDGKRINFYGDLYVNDVKIDEIEGIVGPAGPTGLTGPAGDGGLLGYLHTQASPATVWTINHNLGFRPLVQLLNAGSQIFNADISHPSVNQTVVTMLVAQSGLARLG